METEANDPSREMMLDGNAVAGDLMEMFGTEVTANDAECANCGQVHMVGAMLAFTRGPGLVLRCPSCESVMVRLVRTPRGVYLDVRGATYMRVPPVT
jgi:Family of unknown function (DUF6510)